MALPRGIRNNNPGNIDRGRDRWKGMSADQSGDSRFIVFDEPEWGIRAMVRVLRSYRDRHGLRTIRGIIDRWAPPKENNTEIYIRFVSDKLGVAPEDEIDIDDLDTLETLLRAIIWKECGKQDDGSEWFGLDVIRDGIARA